MCLKSNLAILLCVFLCLGTFSQQTYAGSISCDDSGLEIMDAQIRATPPNAPVTGGYMVIKNHGDKAQRLVSVQAVFSERAELHDMKMQDGVMKMFALENGIMIPAGLQIILKPGGRHIMFMQLNRALKEGTSHEVELFFDDCGAMVKNFSVTKTPGQNHLSHNSDSHHHTHENR